MGMFDSIAQAPTPMGQTPNASAQQQPVQQMDAFKQKMQQRANPMMRARPAMSGGFNQQNSMSQSPNPMTGQRPMMNSLAKNAGQMGSRPDVMQRQQALQEQQQQSQGLGPSIPAYEQLKQNLQAQKGGLKTPYDTQQESLANQSAPAMSQGYGNPLQAPSEQPDMGSQDPRELARMGQMPMNQVPELPMGNVGRPDVMPRNGIGPSFMEQVQMDENGLEPRRGAR